MFSKLYRLVAFMIVGVMMPTTLCAHKGHDHSDVRAVRVNPAHVNKTTPWAGKRVAFLGDSMTDPANTSAELKYWSYLDSLVGLRPVVFARSGYRWEGIYRKAQELHEAWPADSIDAVFIWAGTNDWNGSVPPGVFHTERLDTVNVNGSPAERLHRTLSMVDTTLCGNINRTLSFLKTNYPDIPIVVMTPIHRGYARFSAKNEQPSEEFSNAHGLYIDDYVALIRRGAELWSVPVIDLFAESGIVPALDSNVPYIHNVDSDRLHPSDRGHYRIARLIQSRLPLFALRD